MFQYNTTQLKKYLNSYIIYQHYVLSQYSLWKAGYYELMI